MGLFEKAEGKVTETLGKAQIKYGEVIDSPEHIIKGEAKEICGAGKQVTSQLLDSAQECVKNTQLGIKKNPLTSVAISAGVGFVIGYLLNKK